MEKAIRQGRGQVFAACVLLLFSASVDAQRGYDIVDDHIVIGGREHWEQWKKPNHLAEIDSASAVRPRQLRSIYNILSDRRITRSVQITSKDPRIYNVDSTQKVDILGNPVQDAKKDFVYDYQVRAGVSRAGSNVHLAKNIIDGDPTTFWEPDPQDPIERWWIEVDLGRAVPVESISVRFVEEELGDPFFKYLLLMASNQTLSLTDDRKVNFELFVPHEGPNTEQRTFWFESESSIGGAALSGAVNPGLVDAVGGISSVKTLQQNSADPAWTGKMIETIRIVVTDSRKGRAEQIDSTRWEALPVEERGDIVYFVRDFANREEPVDAATYESLEEERKGRREFYRRELPRLAEVEVWGWGDNIGLGLVEGGGTLDLTSAGKTPGPAFDGDIGSGYQHPTQDPLDPGANVLTIDIGGTVWLDQVRVVGSNIRGYQMRTSTGERDAQGNLRWRGITPPERVKNVDYGEFGHLNDIQDPVRKVRFIDLSTLANFTGDTQNRTDRFWSRFNELMLYAEGVPAEITVESGLIELPGIVTLGKINWEAQLPGDTRIAFRTRSGDQLIQRIRYFDSNGIEKTAAEHKKLLAFLQGPIDTSFAIGPGWSPWSQSYQASGDQVTSPSLRKYLQIQARLISEDRQTGPALEHISVELHTPVASSLYAEVWPAEAAVGQMDTFEVFVQSQFLERPVNIRSLGFDEVMIRADPGLDMQLVDVAVGTEAELVAGNPEQLFDVATLDGLQSADSQVLEVPNDRGDTLLVRLPGALSGGVAGAPQLYYRIVADGGEVPTGINGQLLTSTSHARLPDEVRGMVRYFRVAGEELIEVDQVGYEGLETEDRGPVRYFRKVVGLGNQTLFNDEGDTLNSAQYNRLGGARGWVVGGGSLVRLRFASRVFLHGTKLHVAVRNGSELTPWQSAESGDATRLRQSGTLSIAALGAQRIIDEVSIAPNPFTPNGDQVNDVAQIEFSLFKVYASRLAEVRIYTLDGQLMRMIEGVVLGGRQRFAWNGKNDQGHVVPPGLYICQINIDADAEDVDGRRLSHLIAVAY